MGIFKRPPRPAQRRPGREKDGQPGQPGDVTQASPTLSAVAQYIRVRVPRLSRTSKTLPVLLPVTDQGSLSHHCRRSPNHLVHRLAARARNSWS